MGRFKIWIEIEEELDDGEHKDRLDLYDDLPSTIAATAEEAVALAEKMLTALEPSDEECVHPSTNTRPYTVMILRPDATSHSSNRDATWIDTVAAENPTHAARLAQGMCADADGPENDHEDYEVLAVFEGDVSDIL